MAQKQAPAAPHSTLRPTGELRLPGMVYAAVAALDHNLPKFQSGVKLLSNEPGVLRVLPYAGSSLDDKLSSQDGVAVVTRGCWLARQKLGGLMQDCGEFTSTAANPLGASVNADPEAFGADTANCTVHWYRGQLRIWANVPDKTAFVAAAARLANLPINQVQLLNMPRAKVVAEPAVLVPAIALAQHMQPAPVQMWLLADLGTYCRLPLLSLRPVAVCTPQELGLNPKPATSKLSKGRTQSGRNPVAQRKNPVLAA